MDRLKKMLLYSGLEKEEYIRHRDRVLERDAQNLARYLWITGIGFFLLGISSILTGGFAHINAKIYFSTAAALLILLVIRKCRLKSDGAEVYKNVTLIYLFIAVIYTEAIWVTMTHLDKPAVTFVGVFLILPLLFSQRPLNLILLQGLFAAAFCVITAARKPREISDIDIWNGISFFAVSILAVLVAMPIRTKALVQTEVIREMAGTDMLTGLKNRNAFEIFCADNTQMQNDPICVYADINGLHELNNAKGHKAGDTMLKAVADEMRNAFGSAHAYRIGGDEFAAFVFEDSVEKIEQMTDGIRKALTDRGYHLSIGSASQADEPEDIEALVKIAEKRMYEDKRKYYSEPGHERRSRR